MIQQLPKEICLEGWLGPTLFTPEVRDGELIKLGAFCSPLDGHELSNAFVIGSERETQDNTRTPYAAFCIDQSTGSVHHVGLDPPYSVRFVNGCIGELVASLQTVVAGWPLLKDSDDAAATAALEHLRSKLAAVDPASMADDDAFWPTVLEMCS